MLNATECLSWAVSFFVGAGSLRSVRSHSDTSLLRQSGILAQGGLKLHPPVKSGAHVLSGLGLFGLPARAGSLYSVCNRGRAGFKAGSPSRRSTGDHSRAGSTQTDPFQARSGLLLRGGLEAARPGVDAQPEHRLSMPRSYQHEHTRSRPISEVKHVWARLVLR